MLTQNAVQNGYAYTTNPIGPGSSIMRTPGGPRHDQMSVNYDAWLEKEGKGKPELERLRKLQEMLMGEIPARWRENVRARWNVTMNGSGPVNGSEKNLVAIYKYNPEENLFAEEKCKMAPITKGDEPFPSYYREHLVK